MNDSSLEGFLSRLISPKRLALAVLAGFLTLGLAQAADVNAEYIDGALTGPQVYAGEGYHSIGFANKSDQDVTFNVARLHDGVAVGDFQAANAALGKAIAAGGDESAAVNQFMAAADALSGTVVKANTETDMLVDFQAGNYVVYATPANDMGTVAYLPFEVTESGQPVAAPDETNVLNLADFSFDFPATVTAGDDLWQISNVGQQPHMAIIYKLLPEKTEADLQAYLTDQTGNVAMPFSPDDTVDVEALTPGQTVYLPLNLTSGNWVAVCFVQDMNNPSVAHFQEGMIEAFTVN